MWSPQHRGPGWPCHPFTSFAFWRITSPTSEHQVTSLPAFNLSFPGKSPGGFPGATDRVLTGSVYFLKQKEKKKKPGVFTRIQLLPKQQSLDHM